MKPLSLLVALLALHALHALHNEKFARSVHKLVLGVVDKLKADPEYRAIAAEAEQSENPIEFLDSKKEAIIGIETRILKTSGLSDQQVSIMQKLTDGEARSKFDKWLPKFTKLSLKERKALHDLPGLAA